MRQSDERDLCRERGPCRLVWQFGDIDIFGSLAWRHILIDMISNGQRV